MKILLLGKSSQIGTALYPFLGSLGTVIAPERNSTNLYGDFQQLAKLADTARQVRPDIIVNAAAYTAVDQAQNQSDAAFQINAEAPRVLAQEAAALGAWLVHYSTDYVFNGKGAQPWLETDAPEPLNVYGQTKLEGDLAIQASGCKHLILRTSWVYGLQGRNFARTILEKAQTQSSLQVVNDQFGAPTEANLLADCAMKALELAMQRPSLSGLYHVVAQGEASWFTYAQYLLQQAKLHGLPLRVQAEDLLPVSSEAFKALAKRPANSRLNTHKFCETFGLALPHWQEGATRFVRAFAKLNER